MLEARKSHYEKLDCIGKSISEMKIDSRDMSEAILKIVIELYKSAKAEEAFKDEYFESAYHSPITGELEFIIARILYHYSQKNKKGWKILLRRQVAKTAPDIRIEVGGKTLAIVEIKAKVGWVQSFFSPNQFKRDQERLKSGASKYNPETAIQLSRNQLSKYVSNFKIEPKNIFLLLPTLALVHRKKDKTELSEYYNYFNQTSGLPSENLILLSENLDLDLSHKLGELKPTGRFERMLSILDRNAPLETEIQLTKI